MYFPAAPESVDQRPRWRWVPPLFLGVAVGGLVGCLATLVLLMLSERPKDLIAERFNVANVSNGVRGTGVVAFTGDTTFDLGQPYGGGPRHPESAVYRRLLIQGTLTQPADAGTFCTQLEAQIIAEMSRHAGAVSTSGRSESASGNLKLHKRNYVYHAADGRMGHIELVLELHQDSILGLLGIVEGR
jgi:hypothetical protein